MDEFDVSRPNVARMYDFALGGKDNFPLDRAAACEVMHAVPDAFASAYANRRFVKRAVSHVARAGVTQFIDIGAGLPAEENTHEIVQAVNGRCRVAYVDYDPVVINHARAILALAPNVIAVPGDLREARVILEDPGLRELLEPGQPVAVVLGAVLHYIDGQQAYEAVDYLKQALPPGSYLVISHATADEAGQDETREVRSVYGCASAPLTLRTAAEVGRFFDGLELAEPGVTGVAAWRNKGAGRRERSLCYGGVGRKN